MERSGTILLIKENIMKHIMKMIPAIAVLTALLAGQHSLAEERCLASGITWPAEWTEPYPAHRVVGNLYAVGNAGLSVFLITTDDGHILVNTGFEDSTTVIRANIDALGFRLQDIKLLLTTQAHFDHTAALAEIKALTGAEMWATPADARVLEDGGASDAHFGNCIDFRFKPVKVDRRLADGEVFNFGGVEITTHHHPGHTEGSSSYSWTTSEAGRDYRVAIINMGTINPGKKMLIEPTYPGVAEDFAMTFHKQKQMQLDVWVSSHGTQYNLSEKHQPGMAYDPNTFVDPEGLINAVNALEDVFQKQINEEMN
ncbi:MAG: metallo-beta-lactamase class B [Parasphingorhabdus sp.]|jgi:metallo-beta-lactamase class B